MKPYIRNGRYYLKKQIEGKVYYKALKLRRGQESLLSARLAQAEEEIIAMHFGLPYSKTKTVDLKQAVAQYVNSKKYKKTIDRDRQRLHKICQLWGNPLLTAIKKPHIEKLESHLFAQNFKPATVNRYFELLRHLFNLAIEDGYAKENPVRSYTPFVEDETRRSLTDKELKEILLAAQYIQEHPTQPIHRVIYDIALIALYTGMRLSEILKMKKSYISVSDSCLFYPLTETKYRKRATSSRKKVKIIYLNSKVMEILSNKKSKSDYVFDNINRDSKIVFWTVRKIRRISGVQDFNFHLLRHTVATWVTSGSDIMTSKVLLGHSDLKTTLRYSHPEIAKIKAGVAKIGEKLDSITRGSE